MDVVQGHHELLLYIFIWLNFMETSSMYLIFAALIELVKN